MSQTPSARRREGRNSFYQGGNPDDHNPYLRSQVWGADIRAADWLDGWKEAEISYEPPSNGGNDMTDPAEIDLDMLEDRAHYGTHQHAQDIHSLIAAVKALRERIAELEGGTDKQFYLHRAQKEHDRAEAAEAHAVELVGALQPFIYVGRYANAAEVSKARTVLAATPAAALERARAMQSIKGYFTVIRRKVREHPPSALISETVDTLATEALAKLDAPEPKESKS